jgi:hypothetical protein
MQAICLIWPQSGECALADANATAAQMAAAVRHVRRCLPGARLVLQAVLPKGDYWPNRCSAAIDSFNGVLQVQQPDLALMSPCMRSLTWHFSPAWLL